MNLAILFGGASFEHEISIVSAIALQKILPSCVFIFLNEKHEFYFIQPHNMKSSFFSTKSYQKNPKLLPKKGGFAKEGLFGSKIFFDGIVLSLVHGQDGEDGKLSSLFDFYDIPYIGPRVAACTLSYDKELTKIYAAAKNIPILPYEILHANTPPKTKLQYPLIIKPARLGSSLGISIAKNQDELEYALESAFEFDKKVIVESFLEGVREFNLAGCKTKEGILFSLIEEPKKQTFLDFKQKYLDFSRTTNITQADINKQLATELQMHFSNIYDSFFDGALIRCDFFELNGQCYLNEINPIPGSMANYLFKDFQSALQKLSQNLPRPISFQIQYQLLHQIQHAKGK